MKASVFEMWFEDELLKNFPKYHVINMDNAAFQEKKILYKIAKKKKKYSQIFIRAEGLIPRRLRRGC